MHSSLKIPADWSYSSTENTVITPEPSIPLHGTLIPQYPSLNNNVVHYIAKKRSLTTEEHKVKVSIEETRKPSPSKSLWMILIVRSWWNNAFSPTAKLVTSPASVNHRESKDSPATRHMKKPSRRKPAPPPLPRPGTSPHNALMCLLYYLFQDQENIDNQASVKIREKRRSETPLKSEQLLLWTLVIIICYFQVSISVVR